MSRNFTLVHTTFLCIFLVPLYIPILRSINDYHYVILIVETAKSIFIKIKLCFNKENAQL